jgi:uncharacterized damage-inducible protein DinB
VSADVIKSLYRYNSWVTEKLLLLTDQLNSEDWQKVHAGGRGSIRETFVHALNTHFNWMSYWDGTDPEGNRWTFFDPASYPEPKDIRTLWETVRTKSERFVDTLDDADANRVRSVDHPSGATVTLTLWQMMSQVATHTVQHNSEIAEALTALGHSPGDLDYLFYILE